MRLTKSLEPKVYHYDKPLLELTSMCAGLSPPIDNVSYFILASAGCLKYGCLQRRDVATGIRTFLPSGTILRYTCYDMSQDKSSIPTYSHHTSCTILLTEMLSAARHLVSRVD